MGKTRQIRRDVPNADNVARYCNPQMVIRDPETDELLGVFPQAFALRTRINETYLSLTWLEYFGRDLPVDKQFKEVLKAVRAKHKGIKPSGVFARLNAGRIVEVGSERGHKLRVRDRSHAHDAGYASIENMPQDNSDEALLEAFASDCCDEIRSVSSIP